MAISASTAYHELRQALAELALISHAPTQSYDNDGAGRDSQDDIGGNRPPGSNAEHPGRRPRAPQPDADAKAWDDWHRRLSEWENEREAWLTAYQRKTPTYFARQLERCLTSRDIEELRDECKEVVDAWKHRPIPEGQEPASMADPTWKRYIAMCGVSTQKLADRYGCTPRYINKIKAMDWSTRQEAA